MIADTTACQLMRPEQVAKLLGVKEGTLRSWRMAQPDRPMGPRFVKVGFNVMYDRADVLEWIESRKRSSTCGERAGRTEARA